MTSAEFTYWQAYANQEPFGFHMENFRMGVPAAALVNSIRASAQTKSRPKFVKPTDFYPPSGRLDDRKVDDQQRAYIARKRAERKRKGK